MKIQLKMKNFLLSRKNTEDKGFTMVELLVAMVIGTMVILGTATMFISFVSTQSAAQSTVDRVSDQNAVHRDFHQMIRNASAYRVEEGGTGRYLNVEHGNGQCETWFGHHQEQVVFVLQGNDAENFNKSSGNVGNLARNVARGTHPTITASRIYEDLTYNNDRWFSYAGSSPEDGMEFSFRSTVAGNGENMSNLVSPRSQISGSSHCW